MFAGNGVFELQNAGILLTTNLAWMGHGLPWAGLYPNLQVISVQGLLLAGAILAWVVHSPRTSLETDGAPSCGHRVSRPSAVEPTTGRIAVLQRWAGPIVVVLILGGVIAILALNLNLKGGTPGAGGGRGRGHARSPRHCLRRPAIAPRPPAGFREYPIGDEVEKNQMRIAAVWLAAGADGGHGRCPRRPP